LFFLIGLGFCLSVFASPCFFFWVGFFFFGYFFFWVVSFLSIFLMVLGGFLFWCVSLCFLSFFFFFFVFFGFLSSFFLGFFPPRLPLAVKRITPFFSILSFQGKALRSFLRLDLGQVINISSLLIILRCVLFSLCRRSTPSVKTDGIARSGP